MRNKLLTLCSVLLLTGCMSTQVALDSRFQPSQPPAYEDYFDYYWFGLSGNSTVDLQKVCVDQKPYGFRRLRSLQDGFIGIITLGIYTPVTVRVWCGD